MGTPFMNDNVKVSPTGTGSGSGTCVKLKCPAGALCKDAYNTPDQEATRSCPLSTGTMWLDLCEPAGGFNRKGQLALKHRDYHDDARDLGDGMIRIAVVLGRGEHLPGSGVVFSYVYDSVSGGGTVEGFSQILKKDPSDIVILSSLRTPITRSYKGQLSSAYPEQLLHTVLKATLLPILPDPALIDDVSVGVVLSELGGSKAGRMAMNHAGYDTRTSFYTTNRACSSGLQAITNIANSIAMGGINIGVGAGMESMTRNYGSKAIPVDLWPELKDAERDTRDCIMPMGITMESHRRAAEAQEKGWFDAEIIPVTTMWQETGKGYCYFSRLSSSIIGKWAGTAVAGCRPDEMGIGPALAIPKLMGQAGIQKEEVNVWEINEAFASQAIYCVRELGLTGAYEKGDVNPKGGAIALGHPLGATGARMVAGLFSGVRQEGGTGGSCQYVHWDGYGDGRIVR
ncbi:hypothetical protein DID88_009189 [Monilinia fructigena]|uniref:Thiolase N-terminal domain-containing protein n=1 Tax=Monilinia fructigena TaxID=38457 RepID=A0A395IEI9_9HELO|nr:hypothetical protein DID88_009189 [Monilinia fructigena]